MSFAVPRHVPRFDDSQRGLEDESWVRAGNGKSLGSMFNRFGDDKQLPLYKDKPYHSSGPRRPLWRKRRWLIGLAVGLGLLWTLWTRPWSLRKSDKARLGPGSWFGSRVDTEVVWQVRREKVREVFEQSWDGYKRHAWGKDQYSPLSQKGSLLATSPLGWIIVDSLDSLMIMNLTTQLSEAREWMMTELNYTQDSDVNTFEATTRLLGGLLSAHYLSTEVPEMAPVHVDGTGDTGEDLYIETATDLMDRLYGAFESKSGIPFSTVNLETRHGSLSPTTGATLTAEASGMQLELKYQTKLIGETLFLQAANKAAEKLYSHAKTDALPPALVHPETGQFSGDQIGVGEKGYLFYVNLIKQYALSSGKEQKYKELWRQAWSGISKNLLAKSKAAGLFVLIQRPEGLQGKIVPKMDQSSCVMPGALALATTGGQTLLQARKSGFWTAKDNENMKLAKELLQTCWAMHNLTATGLAADATTFDLGSEPPLAVASEVRATASKQKAKALLPQNWRSDLRIEGTDASGSLNSGISESLFYMWRITQDPQYRDMGWELFNSFVDHAALDPDGPFADLANVDEAPPVRRDTMDPAWLSRTLKYFYLLFSPSDLLPLDKAVFSLGAHPFPKFQPRKAE